MIKCLTNWEHPYVGENLAKITCVVLYIYTSQQNSIKALSVQFASCNVRAFWEHNLHECWCQLSFLADESTMFFIYSNARKRHLH